MLVAENILVAASMYESIASRNYSAIIVKITNEENRRSTQQRKS